MLYKSTREVGVYSADGVKTLLHASYIENASCDEYFIAIKKAVDYFVYDKNTKEHRIDKTYYRCKYSYIFLRLKTNELVCLDQYNISKIGFKECFKAVK